MSEFNDVRGLGLDGLGLGVPATKKGDEKALGQDEFFELMIAQLSHQDPLKPMDSSELLSQVAQFSTVSGIQNIDRSITELAASMQSNQALQASTLVGRNVLVPGDTAVLSPGETVAGAVELTASTNALFVDITDPAGRSIRRLELGPQAAGTVGFSWDGLNQAGDQAPGGHYVLAAQAVLDGKESGVPTLITSKVESVTLGNGAGGIMLNLDGLGTVALSDIRELL